jgi:hypothetical protein
MLCLLQRSNAMALGPSMRNHNTSTIGYIRILHVRTAPPHAAVHAAVGLSERITMYLRLRLGARLCGALSTLGRGSTGVWGHWCFVTNRTVPE